ncbi:hypothetical protein DENSPDRAFT_297187 [Dentipellis sp. KUC8613]|nr:hypothetical protein DENSPDRAFT_297187 [Dentipellis sp. KUC8613]
MASRQTLFCFALHRIVTLPSTSEADYLRYNCVANCIRREPLEKYEDNSDVVMLLGPEISRPNLTCSGQVLVSSGMMTEGAIS